MTAAQQASIGTVPDKLRHIVVLGVGTIDTISNNFSKKLGNAGQKFASGKCLGWRQIHEIVRTVERLMPGFLEVISDFI